jgi:hypothetical protein
MRRGAILVTETRGVPNPYFSIRVLRALLDEIIDEVRMHSMTIFVDRNVEAHVHALVMAMLHQVEFRDRPLYRWFDVKIILQPGAHVGVQFIPVDEYATRLLEQLQMDKSTVEFVRDYKPAPDGVKRVVDL